MKPLNPKARREIALISSISLLGLSPVVFLGVKSALDPRPLDPVAIGPIKPALIAGKSALGDKAALSPDGFFIARVEVPGLDVVIRTARGGREVFRVPRSRDFIAWVPRSLSFIIEDGQEIQVFSPAPPPKGAPAVAPWVQRTVGFSPATDEGRIRYSSDFRFAVRAAKQAGGMNWDVIDLKTGTPAPTVQVGAALAAGLRSYEFDFSVAPLSLSARGLPRVVLVQKDPRLSPTPIPTPAPPFTPAQQRFFESEKTLSEEQAYSMEQMMIPMESRGERNQELYRSLRGEAERMAGLEKRRVLLEARRAALFPTEKLRQRRQLNPRLSDANIYQLDCLDLSAAKPLWKTSLRSNANRPQLKFSPDGTTLVTYGTARIYPTGGTHIVNGLPANFYAEDDGFEFRSPATGQIRATFRLYEGSFSFAPPKPILFYDSTQPNGMIRSIFMVPDSRTIQEKKLNSPNANFTFPRKLPVLRFFDVSTAREISHLDFNKNRFNEKIGHQFSNFSVSDDGQFWLFGDDDFQFTPRSGLGRELFKPLPHPTPRPTPKSTIKSPALGALNF